MSSNRQKSEFPEHANENRRIWDTNAHWWDDQIGDGNDFQTVLIEPATERLLAVSSEDVILDIACGAGRFARRMAELGGTVVAFDYSTKFVERARERTRDDATVEYHVLDAAKDDALMSLGANRFDKAVCTRGEQIRQGGLYDGANGHAGNQTAALRPDTAPEARWRICFFCHASMFPFGFNPTFCRNV